MCANRGDGHQASHHDTCGFVATHLYRFQWGNFHTQDNEHSDIRIYDRDLLGRRFGADGRREIFSQRPSLQQQGVRRGPPDFALWHHPERVPAPPMCRCGCERSRAIRRRWTSSAVLICRTARPRPLACFTTAGRECASAFRCRSRGRISNGRKRSPGPIWWPNRSSGTDRPAPWRTFANPRAIALSARDRATRKMMDSLERTRAGAI